MMTDEPTLPPEVAEAVAVMDSCASIKTDDGGVFTDDWQTIRDYLHRVTAEWDALRKRIESAPVRDAEWVLGHGLTFMDAPIGLDGKCVALVLVEE